MIGDAGTKERQVRLRLPVWIQQHGVLHADEDACVRAIYKKTCQPHDAADVGTSDRGQGNDFSIQ